MTEHASDVLTRWMAAMTESARAINEEHELPAVLAMIARQACELLGLQQCAVWVLDPDSGSLRIEGSHGLSPGYIERTNHEPMRLDEATARTGPPTARAALTGRPVLMRDAFAEPGLERWRANMASEGLRAIVAAPMRTADKAPIGTLTGYTLDERSYDSRDLDQLALLSDHAAAAITAARRRESERAAIAALSSTNAELRTQQATVTWLRDLQQGLTRLLLQDVGLSGIADFLATRLTAEITIETAEGTMLAVAPQDATPPHQVLEPVTAGRVNEILSSGRASHIGPPGSPACLVPIPGGDDPPTRMWVRRRHADHFLDHERQAMEGCALLIALERSRIERRAEAEARLAKDLLADLLSPAAMLHPDSVMARATTLGHEPRGLHLLVVFVQTRTAGQQDLVSAASLAAALLDTARDARPRPVIGTVGEAVVTLLPAPHGPKRLRRDLLPLLTDRARQVTDGAARCVIGATEHPLIQIERELTVVLHAAQLVTPASPETVNLTDFGVHGLLLESGTSERLVRFTEQTLAPLVELDRTRRTDLLATLHAWFAADMSTRRAAEQLFVHPNTVGYRLKRAARAADLDLARPADLMTLQLALTVDEIRGSTSSSGAHPA